MCALSIYILGLLWNNKHIMLRLHSNTNKHGGEKRRRYNKLLLLLLRQIVNRLRHIPKYSMVKHLLKSVCCRNFLNVAKLKKGFGSAVKLMWCVCSCVTVRAMVRFRPSEGRCKKPATWRWRGWRASTPVSMSVSQPTASRPSSRPPVSSSNVRRDVYCTIKYDTIRYDTIWLLLATQPSMCCDTYLI